MAVFKIGRLCLAVLLTIAASTVSAQTITAERMLDFSPPSKEEQEAVSLWLSDLYSFSNLHPKYACILQGEYVTGRRPKPESSRTSSVSYLAAVDSKKSAKRKYCVSQVLLPRAEDGVRVTPSDPTIFRGGLVTIPYTGWNSDFLKVDKNAWVTTSDRQIEVTEDRQSSVEAEFGEHGFLDPLADTLFVIPVGSAEMRTLQQRLDSNQIKATAMDKGILYARWLFPLEHPMVYGLVMGFKDEKPVIVYDELGMGLDEKFKRLWSQGYNEIEWKKNGHQDMLPYAIRKVNASKPEDRKRNAVDSEWILELNWFLDDAVPAVFFDRESLGNLDIEKYVPK